MNKIIRIIKLLVFSIFLVNCSSDNATPEPEPEIPDNVRPPYTVRYEVRFSSSQVRRAPQISHAYEYGGTWRIATAPGTTHYVNNSELINGWTKEFTVTVNRNPLRIECSVCYEPLVNASYTTKMYVNNVLVKQQTWNRSPVVSGTSGCTFDNDTFDVY
jgi:hypothetical protein